MTAFTIDNSPSSNAFMNGLRVIREMATHCALLLLGGVFFSAALAQEEAVTPPGIETDGYAEIDARGAGLFAVPIPGETYDPLSGAIGHNMVDMRIDGNGQLPMVISRKFEEIARSYPHRFGNMSLNIPRLFIDARIPDPSQDLDKSGDPSFIDCGWVTDQSLVSSGGYDERRVWNDIKFYYAGGMVSLVDKRYLANPSAYPAEARFVSQDNWYLSCDASNTIFLLHAPDGTVYQFWEQERVHALRGFSEIDDNPQGTGLSFEASTHSTSKYMVYVSEVRKLGARLNYFYEQAPKPNDEPNYYRAYPPYFTGEFAEHDGPNEVNRNTIRNKIRPIRIEGTTDIETSSGADNRVLNIEYNDDPNSECPYLISRIASPNATNTEVNYSYTMISESTDTYSLDQCSLNRVTYADGSHFTFTYGASDTTPFLINGDYSDVSASYPSQAQFAQDFVQLHSPIRTVRIPTGALVTYDYNQLGLCEYQDVYDFERRGDYVSWGESCIDDSNLRRPTVVKRVVTANDIPTTEINIYYEALSFTDGSNRVRRIIDNPTRRHDLIFARIDRYTPLIGPVGASPNDPGNTLDYPEEFLANYGGRMLTSGRLLSQTTQLPGDTGAILSTVDYQYLENANPWIDYSKMRLVKGDASTEPDDRLHARPHPFLHTSVSPEDEDEFDQNPNFRVYSSRWMFVFDAVRTNTDTVTINHNNATFVTTRRNFDLYNFPERVDEKHLGSGIDESRTTELAYDHNFDSRINYTLGLNATASTGPMDANGNAVVGESIINTYDYDPRGQIGSQTKAGFASSFAYYSSGDLASFTDGRNNTWFYENYELGTPRTTKQAGGGIAETFVNARGLVEADFDAEANILNYRYDSLGRITHSWTGAVSGPSSNYQVVTQHPVWHLATNPLFRKKVETHKNVGTGEVRYTLETEYDALGRVERTKFTDLFADSDEIWHRYVYDWMGRTIFVSDPSGTDNGVDPAAWLGTFYEYDGFDRLAIARHNGDQSAINYCYGPDCSTGVYTVKHGYLKTDQAGNYTAVNFRAFGHPSNGEVVQMIQEIEDQEAVTTNLFRYSYGFIGTVAQGIPGQSEQVRTYIPYVNNNSLTDLVASEEHPEFGIRSVLDFDGNGNVKLVSNYSSGTIAYTYSPRNQLTQILSQSSNEDIREVRKDYDYFLNDNLKSATSFFGTEFVASVRNYEYLPGKNLLTAEKVSYEGANYDIGYSYDGYDTMAQMSYPDGRTIDYERNGRGLAESLGITTGGSLEHACTAQAYCPATPVYHSSGANACSDYFSGWRAVNGEIVQELGTDQEVDASGRYTCSVTYCHSGCDFTGVDSHAPSTRSIGADSLFLINNATYHPNGLLASVEYGNGQKTTTTQNSRSLTEAITTMAQVEKQHDTQRSVYQYDTRRNVNGINAYLYPNADINGNLNGFVYDGLNRLKKVSGQWGNTGDFVDRSYTYDVLGNIKSSSNSLGQTLTYNYDNTKNRLVDVRDSDNTMIRDFSYDDNGNVVAAKPIIEPFFMQNEIYEYDELNRLVSYERSDGDDFVFAGYNYDAHDHLLETASEKFEDFEVLGEEKVRITVYSQSGDLLHERDLLSDATKNHIYFGGKRIASLGSHNFADTDNDGILDYYERLHNLNPNDPSDGNGDLDGDGLSNFEESALGTIAMNADSDDDGMSDGFEQTIGSDLFLADGNGDADGDGIPNNQEGDSDPEPPITPTNISDQVPLWYEQLFY